MSVIKEFSSKFGSQLILFFQLSKKSLKEHFRPEFRRILQPFFQTCLASFFSYNIIIHRLVGQLIREIYICITKKILWHLVRLKMFCSTGCKLGISGSFCLLRSHMSMLLFMELLRGFLLEFFFLWEVCSLLCRL